MANDAAPLLMLTMRGADDRRSRAAALVTMITPKTFVSKTARTMTRSTELGIWSRASSRRYLPGAGDAGVVDQNVEAPEAFLDLLCRRLDAGLVRDVEGQCASPPAERKRRGFIAATGVSCADQHDHAAAGELLGSCTTGFPCWLR